MDNISTTKFDEYRKILNKDGFVHIKNAFLHNEVELIRGELDDMFHCFTDLSDAHGKVHLNDDCSNEKTAINEINRILKLNPHLKKSNVVRKCREIARNLSGRRMFYSFDHAIYKSPLSGSVKWHQDQAYKARVKEMQSLHFWIPLHDISSDKGGMKYIAGSHKEKFFPHNKHPLSDTLFVSEDRINELNVVKLQVVIGDVVIHLPKTLHSSLPNMSDEKRKAWIVHFGPYGCYEPILPSNLLYYYTKKTIQFSRSNTG